METRPVINMKLFMIPLLLCLVATSLEAQIEQPIHLSYNLDKYCNSNKIIKKNGDVLFKIENQFFKYDEKNQIKKLTSKEIDEIEMVNLSNFLEKAMEKRRKLIKKNSVRILSNNEVFDKIYLYEKIENGNIKRYPVLWSSMIE